MRARYRGKTVIAGVDELYQTNAIRFKIQGFHRLLREFPLYRGSLVLVQVCFQQRSVTAAGQQQRLYEQQVEAAAAACNAEFPRSVELVLLSGSYYPASERMALWRVADVYLNTALAQGLNLHPQEYLLARREAGGIVIVSEFANSHEFLNGALSVNPWDVTSIVGQLETALAMSRQEVAVRQQRDILSISRREKKLWSSLVIQNLVESKSRDTVETTRSLGLSDDDLNSVVIHLDVESLPASQQMAQVHQRYAQTDSHLFILDYGGTLIAKEGLNRDLKDDFRGVQNRSPSPPMACVLQRLCDDPRNEVWVISSSGGLAMEKTLGGFARLGLIAVNGLKVRPVGLRRRGDAQPQASEWQPSPEYQKKSLPYLEEILSLCGDYVFRTNGSTLYHDNYVVRFHYQYCDPDFGKQMAEHLTLELEELLRDVSVKVVHDAGVVEVRSFLGTRGDIVKMLLQRYRDSHGANPQMVTCIGDSAMDEPMFE